MCPHRTGTQSEPPTPTHSLAVFRPLRPLKLGDGPILKFLMQSMTASLLSSRLSSLSRSVPLDHFLMHVHSLDAPVRDIDDF